jgi:Flp pilus assembly protein CpaB
VKRSNRLLILLGVFLAVIAMMAVVVIGGGGTTGGAKASPTPTPEPQVEVVIAKVDMALGDRITADMVETQTMTLSERDALGVDTFSNTTQVVGKVVGGQIIKGTVLSASAFLSPGSITKGQDLASAIAPGRVAVAMEVDQVNGVGTLIVPGDHVDVILSVWIDDLKIALEASDETGGYKIEVGGNPAVTTKMVIQNRKVLVTLLPQAEATEEPAPAAAGTATPEPKPSAETVANTGQHMIVIVEVLPEEAEVIRYAQRMEITDPQNYITLGLALRSDKDNDAPPVTTAGITFRQLVTIYGVLPPDARGIIPEDIAKQIQW